MASQFARAVASAQAGYGGRGRDGSFYQAHSQQHTDTLDRMDAHDRRLAALEALDPSTFHAATGKVLEPGPQNSGEM
jgi:hypothetical protein